VYIAYRGGGGAPGLSPGGNFTAILLCAEEEILVPEIARCSK
jgi:hypothetical protein